MSQREQQVYIDPSEEAGIALVRRGIEGPVTMLNLLRFREIADYSGYPDLAPEEPISGRAAYDRYIAHTMPYLRETGGELTYLGEGGPFMIGPPGRGWDLVMLVRQTSIASFISFASNPGCMAGIGHRVAALSDSRLLPLVDVQT